MSAEDIMNLTSKVEYGFTYIAGEDAGSAQKVASKQTGVLFISRSIRRMRDHSFGTWLLILPRIRMLALFGLPLMALIARAIQSNFLEQVFSGQALNILRLSLVTSLVTVLLAICGGTPLAYILARWAFPHRSLVHLLIDLPVVLLLGSRGLHCRSHLADREFWGRRSIPCISACYLRYLP